MWTRSLPAVGLAVCISVCAVAAEVGSPINMTRLGNAIHGYDPVAYHRLGEAVIGDRHIVYEWRHATWLFANVENRELFAAEPDKYVPAYGGYCAFAVAHGIKLDVDPQAWNLRNGRLFLYESMIVKRAWEQDIPFYVENGDLAWKEIRYK